MLGKSGLANGELSIRGYGIEFSLVLALIHILISLLEQGIQVIAIFRAQC